MKTLLLDVGNSRVKWGVHENAEIHRTGNVSQSRIEEEGLSALITKLPRDVDSVFACNVAGERFAKLLSDAVALHCGCELRFACSEAKAYGVTNSYPQPRLLGVDRWVAMVAARATCDTFCVIVDAGTAITIDALKDNGDHLGGQILPGIMLMTEVLASSTSDLALVGRPEPGKCLGKEAFANNTSAAILTGAKPMMTHSFANYSTIN